MYRPKFRSLTKIPCNVLNGNRVFVVESVILALCTDAIDHDTGIGGQSCKSQRNVTVNQTNFSNCSFFLQFLCCLKIALKFDFVKIHSKGEFVTWPSMQSVWQIDTFEFAKIVKQRSKMIHVIHIWLDVLLNS